MTSNSAYNRFRKQFFAQGKMFKSYPALKICRLATSKSTSFAFYTASHFQLNRRIRVSIGKRKDYWAYGTWIIHF